MKHIFFSILLLFFSIQLFSQRIELTKEQMYEDFDEFYSIIKDVNPQLTVRKKVTGIDILSEIKKTRQSIDTISNTSYFIKLLLDNLKMCNDMHNVFITGERVVSILNDDMLKLSKFEKLYNQTDEDFAPFLQDYIPLPFFLDYYKGNYYNIGSFKIKTEEVLDSIPQSAKIIAINDIAIDSVLRFSFKYNSDLRSNWDRKQKRAFFIIRAGNVLVERRDTITVKYKYKGTNHIFHYYESKSKWLLANGGYFFNTAKDGYVDYFPESNILYIRLPQMSNDKFYIKDIIKKGKDVPLKKVVIDIRQNGGGADYVWMNILSTIINKPLDIRATIGYKNTNRVIEALELDKDSVEITKVPLLDNEEFGTLTWGKIIEPSDSSLNFGGKIYILQDRLIFSSAGSLSNVAKMSDNIISIGETTGNLLGFGIAPISFVLPNSLFIFQLEPVLDLSNVNSIYDFYHDNVEIPVEISVEQRVKYFNNYNPNQAKGIYSKDYLYNHDPVFQKVLKLK